MLNKVPVTRAIYPKLIFVDSADCQVSDSMHKCLNFRYQQEIANALYSLQLVKGQYENISVLQLVNRVYDGFSQAWFETLLLF